MAQKGYGLIWNGEVVSQLFKPFIVVRAAIRLALSRGFAVSGRIFGDLPGAALPRKLSGLPRATIGRFFQGFQLAASPTVGNYPG